MRNRGGAAQNPNFQLLNLWTLSRQWFSRFLHVFKSHMGVHKIRRLLDLTPEESDQKIWVESESLNLNKHPRACRGCDLPYYTSQSLILYRDSQQRPVWKLLGKSLPSEAPSLTHLQSGDRSPRFSTHCSWFFPKFPKLLKPEAADFLWLVEWILRTCSF